METGEKKTDGSKEENHPSGENTKFLPINENAPPVETAMPELPKVECVCVCVYRDSILFAQF